MLSSCSGSARPCCRRDRPRSDRSCRCRGWSESPAATSQLALFGSISLARCGGVILGEQACATRQTCGLLRGSPMYFGEVGIGQFFRFDHGVQRAGLRGTAEVFAERKRLHDVEHFERGDALAVGRHLVDRPAAIGGGDGIDPFGGVVGEILRASSRRRGASRRPRCAGRFRLCRRRRGRRRRSGAAMRRDRDCGRPGRPSWAGRCQVDSVCGCVVSANDNRHRRVQVPRPTR